MGDEVDDLWAKAMEQGFALEGLQRAAADAKARQKSSHAELLEIMARIGSGREKPLCTAVGAGRDAVAPSSKLSDVGDGSRGGERVPAKSIAGGIGARREYLGYCPTVRTRDLRPQPKTGLRPQRNPQLRTELVRKAASNFWHGKKATILRSLVMGGVGMVVMADRAVVGESLERARRTREQEKRRIP